MHGHRLIQIAVIAAVAVGGSAIPAAALPLAGPSSSKTAASNCAKVVDPARFASAGTLETLTSTIAGFGLRTTASTQHERLIDWLETKYQAIPGFTVRSDPYTVKRWQPTPVSATLPGRDLGAAGTLSIRRAGGGSDSIPTAGAIPFTLPTGPAGRSAPLVYLPPNTDITAQNARGRIVIRDVTEPSVPNVAIAALSHYLSPDTQAAISGSYSRPFFSTVFDDDSIAAGKAGAAGLILSFNVPGQQVKGYFDPHSGTYFRMPGVFVGVDEASRLKQAAAMGKSATIGVQAEIDTATTRNLVATLPGTGRERVILNANTDGNTWVQENGNAALLKIADYLARIPVECRTRTYEFVLASSHLQLSTEGSARFARQLDRDVDKGTVAYTFPVEHLGTREIIPVPRTDGPGERLTFSGKGEPYSWFGPTESPVLSSALVQAVRRHPADNTVVVRGFDIPRLGQVPTQCSFGGLGTIFHEHLIPTIAGISGPWSLWAPSFGKAAIDFKRMRQQSLVVADTLLALDRVPRQQIAGAYIAERSARAAGVPTCSTALPPIQAP